MKTSRPGLRERQRLQNHAFNTVKMAARSAQKLHQELILDRDLIPALDDERIQRQLPPFDPEPELLLEGGFDEVRKLDLRSGGARLQPQRDIEYSSKSGRVDYPFAGSKGRRGAEPVCEIRQRDVLVSQRVDAFAGADRAGSIG